MKSTTIAFKTTATGYGAGYQGDRSPTLLQRLRLWRQRANGRRRLSQLSRRELEDIGIDRGDAEIEAVKPFWKV